MGYDFLNILFTILLSNCCFNHSTVIIAQEPSSLFLFNLQGNIRYPRMKNKVTF